MIKLPTPPLALIESAQSHPGEVEVFHPFIACAGGVIGHTDEGFPPWSAFFTIRNDDCIVWQRGGYRGIPKPGDRFVLNIHKQHGVLAPRRAGVQLLIVVCAEAQSKRTAINRLAVELRALRKQEQVEVC